MRFTNRLSSMSAIILGLVIIAASAVLPAQQIANAQVTQAGKASDTKANARITLRADNMPLDQALSEIAKQARMGILRRADGLVMNSRVNVNLKGVSVAQALSVVTRGTNVSAEIASDGETITLAQVKKGSGDISQGVISGRITDARSGRGIAGVRISVDNEGHGSVTGEDGVYRLVGISAGAHKVTVRLVGYTKQVRIVTVGESATVTADFKMEPSTNVLDQVVVTGTVAQTELKAVPNAITIITAKQIEERGITRIDQLFRGDVPGLFSVNTGSNGQLGEVIMFSRGATALTNISAGVSATPDFQFPLTNPIKTYIDGVELADPKYISQIDPTSIERIEILTGPQASTIYGSNAINGVMQIFTKRGTTAKPELLLSITSGVSQNNFNNHLAPNHIADARLSGLEGKISYNVGGSWNYTGSWTPAIQGQRMSIYGGGHAGLQKVTVDASARHGTTYNFQRGNATQQFSHLTEIGYFSPSASQGLPTPQTRTLNGQTVGLTLRYNPLSWWSHEVVLGSDASVTEMAQTEGSLGRVRDTLLAYRKSNVQRTSQSYNTTMQAPLLSFAGMNLTMGADHWRLVNTSVSASPQSLTGNLTNINSLIREKPAKNTGAFLQGQFAIKDALFLTYGVRGDWNPNFGDKVKVKPGRYGASYTRDIETPLGQVSVKFRGSYGRSIRPPQAGLASASIANFAPESFGNFNTRLANADLGPEHQQGGEGGIELYMGSRGSLVVTRYNQTIDNLIANVYPVDSIRSIVPNASYCAFLNNTDPNGYCYFRQDQYLNVGSIRNQGWETQGSLNLGPITTRATYSWTKSRIVGITPRYRSLLTSIFYQVGRSFDYLPEHTWAVHMAYSNASSTAAVTVNGTGLIYRPSGSFGDYITYAGLNRIMIYRPLATDIPGSYHPMGQGYATADFNATHRFSKRIETTLQVNNFTNFYQNDMGSAYATIGRQTNFGIRLRL